ncbi:MAG: KOW motif-containing protein [Luteimonas sp.]
MDTAPMPQPKNGDHCLVTAGSHKGKTGRVDDLHASRTGAITITVVQSDGTRFKTLAKHVVVQPGRSA